MYPYQYYEFFLFFCQPVLIHQLVNNQIIFAEKQNILPILTKIDLKHRLVNKANIKILFQEKWHMTFRCMRQFFVPDKENTKCFMGAKNCGEVKNRNSAATT
jgi:hypothetical protein